MGIDIDTEFCATRDVYHSDWRPSPGRRIHHWFDRHMGFKRALAEQCVGLATAVVTETVEERFMRLADEWSMAIGHVSSASDLINDSRYQQIIALNWPVLPYMLRDLDRKKRFWFPALAAITGLRPFDSKDGGNYRLMTEAWLRWGRRKGLI
jgi:hypothetical protein